MSKTGQNPAIRHALTPTTQTCGRAWRAQLTGAPFSAASTPLAGQGIILASILGVTGIPPTEKQAIRSKGDAYRAYQARVSRFIPRPPKRT